MGFYIEDLPTEFNGITMQEADYFADEFLSETPCNRMWDAMRALRDFYETVMNDAVEVKDRKDEPRKEHDFCGKCRYLYRDFKYGLSCYRLMDNEPCKYEERKTENSSEKPNNCKPTGYNLSPVDKDINVRSKNERSE